MLDDFRKNHLKIGTSLEEISVVVGKPDRVILNGTEKLYYDVEMLPHDLDCAYLVIEFDKTRRLVRTDYFHK
jgi:hypothetical protein